MSKQKVIVETITNYTFRHQKPDGTVFEGTLKVNGEYYKVEVNVKNIKNVGGEAWDWAQTHWDEFIPAEGPPLIIEEGEDKLTIPTSMRWACVSGVYDPEMNHLPIEEVRSKKGGKYAGYGRAEKKKRGGTTPDFKVKEETTSLREVGTQKTAVKAANKPKTSRRKLSAVDKLVEGTDVESIKQEKIRKVMDEE